MAEINKPANLSLPWAKTGDKHQPSDSKISTGWVLEYPTFQDFNWIQNRADTAIAHINQHGIPVWDNETEYRANKSYVQGSDGNIYKAKFNHTNINPVPPVNPAEDDPALVYWTCAVGIGSNTVNVITKYSDIATSAGVVGKLFVLKGHTVDGVGGGLFQWVSSSGLTADTGMISTTATVGVYAKRVNYEKATIEMFGCVPGTTIDELSTLNGPFDKALAWSSANKIPLYVTGTNYTIVKTAGRVVPWVSLHGIQKPKVKDDYSALEDGTIIKGVLRIDCQYASISNLGIDHGVANYPASPNDALFVFSSTEDGEWACLKDCVGLGRAPLDAFHALGIEGFINSDMIDCVGVRTYYGAAIKVRKGFIRGFRGYGNAVAGLVIRSNLGNLVEDLIVDDVITIGIGNNGSGSAGTDYGVYLVADSQAQRVVLNNIICKTTQRGVSIRPNANINELIVNNLITDDTGNSGFDIQDAAANVFTLQTDNHQHLACQAWGYYPYKAVSLQASNLYCSSVSGSSYLTELVRIGPGVLNTTINNVILSSNRSESVLGAIRYDNANVTNSLGSHRCYLSNSGSGYPSNTTVTQPSITGSTATLTPVYNSSLIHVMKVVHASGAATVTTIGTSPVAGTVFPWGYRLVIFNDSVTTLTLGASGTGYLNKIAGSPDVVQGSHSIEFVFDGLSWIPTALS